MSTEYLLFLTFYSIAVFVLALFGLHKFFLLHFYNKYKKQPLKAPLPPDEWPKVTVQLPIYNEKYVVKR
ncbi:MAG: glycosyl transferase family 2, partial [Calditrichia bacterium]